jgi:hypothetical protein
MGSAEGTKNGASAVVSKEWLIDTGAEVSAITNSNADNFDLTPLGATARATSTGAGLAMHSGLTMVFEVKDSTGKDVTVNCSLDVGVKPDDSGSEILGMDQIAHVNARVEWDPAALDGDLRQ